jgi:hypothetical protein
MLRKRTGGRPTSLRFCEIRYIYADIASGGARFFAFCRFQIAFGGICDERDQPSAIATQRALHIRSTDVIVAAANVTLSSFQTVA